MKKHIAVGFGASLLLLAIFAGVMTLTEGFRGVQEQARALWPWLLALTMGFGVQAGLVSFIRDALRERRAAATASVAASGTVSAGSMLACCAHHLSDFLPLLGVAALSTFLGRFQTLFLLAGVLSNMVGITLMLETMQRHDLSNRLAGWKHDLGRIRRGAIVLTVLLLGLVVIVSWARPG